MRPSEARLGVGTRLCGAARACGSLWVLLLDLAVLLVGWFAWGWMEVR
jgi:hypothetical protein